MSSPFGLGHRLGIPLKGVFHKTHETRQTIFKKSGAQIPDFSLQKKNRAHIGSSKYLKEYISTHNEAIVLI